MWPNYFHGLYVCVSGFSATAKEPVYRRIIVLAFCRRYIFGYRLIAAINEFLCPSVIVFGSVASEEEVDGLLLRGRATVQLKFCLHCRLTHLLDWS